MAYLLLEVLGVIILLYKNRLRLKICSSHVPIKKFSKKKLRNIKISFYSKVLPTQHLIKTIFIDNEIICTYY